MSAVPSRGHLKEGLVYGAGVTQEEAAEQPLTIAEILQSPGSNLGVTFNCLVFLDWKERGQFAFSNREWRTLSQNDSFGNWLCDRLHEECRLYVPPRPPPGLRWGTLFRDLWPLHRMWLVDPQPQHIPPTPPKPTSEAPALPPMSPELIAHVNDDDKGEILSALTSGGKDEAVGAEAGDEAVVPLQDNTDRFGINVIVRFRPERERKDEEAASAGLDKENKQSFHLPLHQRLHLIKARDRHGDRSLALQTLKSEGGWFSSGWKKKQVSLGENGDAAEEEADGKQGQGDDGAMHAHIHSVDSGMGSVVAVAPGIGLREFSFDHVLDKKTHQGPVFESAARQLITDFLNGYNSTILVYGQTGSGKTWTMFGPDIVADKSGQRLGTADDPEQATAGTEAEAEEVKEGAEEAPEGDTATAQEQGAKENEDTIKTSEPETAPADATGTAAESPSTSTATESVAFGRVMALRGIVPRAAEEVLKAAAEKRRQGISVELSVSFVEIFGDEVNDLLRGGQRCGHSKVAAQRFVLNGAAKRPIHTLAELQHCLETGEAQKRRAATKMNERSSRAHALFIMTMECRDYVSDREVKSQLFLADLGGSEQVKRSEVHHGEMSEHHGHVLGTHMREAVYINLGLLALKKCIVALNNGSCYVPYQDSKLTMLLSPALGGNSKTSVIVCGSVDDENAKETIQALRFGEACSKVENAAAVDAVGAAQMLEDIDRQMTALEQAIQQNERWETTEVIRKDTNVEAGTFEAALAARSGGEVIKVGKVVGAEKERVELEALIVKRARLLGEDPDLKLAEAGFGGQFGGKAGSLGGHAEKRFANKSEGLKIKGKVVADWAV